MAVESLAGRRTIHSYVDPTTPALEQIRAAVAAWTQGEVSITAQRDPGWDAVQRLCD